MRTAFLALCVLLPVVVIGFISPTEALQRPVSFARLCQKSERIAVGTVERLAYRDAEWPGIGRLPFTEVTLEVHRVFKGERSLERLILHVPGGLRPSGSRVHVSEMPHFTVGEKVLVFTHAYNGQQWVHGWQQGKYRVTGNRVVGRPGYPIPQDVLLFALERRVRAVLTAAGDRKGG